MQRAGVCRQCPGWAAPLSAWWDAQGFHLGGLHPREPLPRAGDRTSHRKPLHAVDGGESNAQERRFPAEFRHRTFTPLGAASQPQTILPTVTRLFLGELLQHLTVLLAHCHSPLNLEVKKPVHFFVVFFVR